MEQSLYETLSRLPEQNKIPYPADDFSDDIYRDHFFLYQLSPEPVLYVALLWLLSGLTACMTGFSNYRKKLQQLTLVATAPDINLSRMDTPSDQIESLQQDIMHRLNQMRMNVETAGRKSLEEMTDYYTMWAHQIKTPIFALRLLLQENPSANKEALA